MFTPIILLIKSTTLKNNLYEIQLFEYKLKNFNCHVTPIITTIKIYFIWQAPVQNKSSKTTGDWVLGNFWVPAHLVGVVPPQRRKLVPPNSLPPVVVLVVVRYLYVVVPAKCFFVSCESSSNESRSSSDTYR